MHALEYSDVTHWHSFPPRPLRYVVWCCLASFFSLFLPFAHYTACYTVVEISNRIAGRQFRVPEAWVIWSMCCPYAWEYRIRTQPVKQRGGISAAYYTLHTICRAIDTKDSQPVIRRMCINRHELLLPQSECFMRALHSRWPNWRHLSRWIEKQLPPLFLGKKGLSRLLSFPFSLMKAVQFQWSCNCCRRTLSFQPFLW